MRNTPPTLLLKINFLGWLSIRDVVLRFLDDPLSDIRGNFAPVLQLVDVQLEDTEVRMRVQSLPRYRVEVSTELRQSFELYRSHLLVAVEYIVDHAENFRGLLLVVSQCDHPGPS